MENFLYTDSVHLRFFNERAVQALSKVQTFDELRRLVIGTLKHQTDKLEFVSGPLFSGGHGFEVNLNQLAFTIEYMAKEWGHRIFSQIPFQICVEGLVQKWKRLHSGTEQCQPMLDMYQSIFATRKLSIVHSMPGWRDSAEAAFERKAFEDLRLRTHDITAEFVVSATQWKLKMIRADYGHRGYGGHGLNSCSRLCSRCTCAPVP